MCLLPRTKGSRTETFKGHGFGRESGSGSGAIKMKMLQQLTQWWLDALFCLMIVVSVVGLGYVVVHH
jgi:hypothetical protein